MVPRDRPDDVGPLDVELVARLVLPQVVDDLRARWKAKPGVVPGRHHPAGQRGVGGGGEQPEAVPHVLPGSARALFGIEDDEVGSRREPSPAQVVTSCQPRLASPDNNGIDLLAHVSIFICQQVFLSKRSICSVAV